MERESRGEGCESGLCIGGGGRSVGAIRGGW